MAQMAHASADCWVDRGEAPSVEGATEEDRCHVALHASVRAVATITAAGGDSRGGDAVDVVLVRAVAVVAEVVGLGSRQLQCGGQRSGEPAATDRQPGAVPPVATAASEAGRGQAVDAVLEARAVVIGKEVAAGTGEA